MVKFRVWLIACAVVLALAAGCSSKAAPTTTKSTAPSSTASSTTTAKTTQPTTSVSTSTTAKTSAPTTTTTKKPPEQMSYNEWKTWYDSEMAALTAKIQGTTLTLYSGTEPQTFMDAITKYFNDKYKVKVQFITLTAAQLDSRIAAESAAGKVVGDYHQAGSSSLRAVAGGGYYEAYTPPAIYEPGVKWFLDPLLDKNETSLAGKAIPVLVFPTPQGAMYNTKMVPADKVPKTYQDLLDPFWKGKILFNDPRTTSVGNSIFFYMRKFYGEGYFEKLKAQQLVWERDYALGARKVASGEFAIFVGLKASYMEGMENLPVQFVYPEGIYLTLTQGAVIKGAPNSSAAKFYLNFTLSKEGQKMAAETGLRTPLRSDVKAAQAFNDISNTVERGIKILPASTFLEDTKDKKEIMELAKRIWGG